MVVVVQGLNWPPLPSCVPIPALPYLPAYSFLHSLACLFSLSPCLVISVLILPSLSRSFLLSLSCSPFLALPTHFYSVHVSLPYPPLTALSCLACPPPSFLPLSVCLLFTSHFLPPLLINLFSFCFYFSLSFKFPFLSLSQPYT